MLNFDPTSSSQNAERQRRLSAEEKSRVNRLADATTLRESQARAVAEAPAEADVERFRALMSGADKAAAQNRKPTFANAPAHDGDQHSASVMQASNAPGSGVNRNASSLADRYRAMLLASSTPDAGGRSNAGDDDQAAAAKGGGSKANDATVDAKKTASGPNDHAAKSAAADVADVSGQSRPDQPTSEGVEAGSKPVDGDALADKSAGTDKARTTGKADAGKAADANAALERKAASGDTQALVVTRKKSDAGDSGAAGAGQQDAPQAMLTTPQTAFNPMATSPQSLQNANTAQASIPQAGMIAPQLVELIRNNVKQMLISDGRSARLRTREVLLRMQDDTLPGTDLWLTRTDDGWHLRADISSRDGYDTLMANKDELIQRFADQALGELSIEPIYHD